MVRWHHWDREHSDRYIVTDHTQEEMCSLLVLMGIWLYGYTDHACKFTHQTCTYRKHSHGYADPTNGYTGHVCRFTHHTCRYRKYSQGYRDHTHGYADHAHIKKLLTLHHKYSKQIKKIWPSRFASFFRLHCN